MSMAVMIQHYFPIASREISYSGNDNDNDNDNDKQFIFRHVCPYNIK